MPGRSLRAPGPVLLLVLALAVVSGGCGSPSSVPAPAPSPSGSAFLLVPHGTFTGRDTNAGLSFTFTLGAAVPAGEFAIVNSIPPVPCQGTGCTSVGVPFGFQLRVGPSPLDVTAFSSVAITGWPQGSLVGLRLVDANDTSSFAQYAVVPSTGGTLQIIAENNAAKLVPDRLYTFEIPVATPF